MQPRTLSVSYESSHDSQLVDVWVEDTVYEADARRLVWVLIGELDVDLPDAAFERGYGYLA